MSPPRPDPSLLLSSSIHLISSMMPVFFRFFMFVFVGFLHVCDMTEQLFWPYLFTDPPPPHTRTHTHTHPPFLYKPDSSSKDLIRYRPDSHSRVSLTFILCQSCLSCLVPHRRLVSFMSYLISGFQILVEKSFSFFFPGIVPKPCSQL